MARYIAIVAVVLSACGEGDEELVEDAATSDARALDGAAALDSAAPDAPDDEDAGSDAAADSSAPPPGCTSSLPPGLTAQTIEHDGETRGYSLMIPSAVATAAAPMALVLDLHGYTETADRQNGRSDMRALGEDEGFIVVQPEGSGALQSWNGGRCCGSAASRELDDVGLVRAIVADVAARTCVDAARVYATGLSNGGFLSHRLACEAADLVAAVAPVAAVIGVPTESCAPAAGVGVMHVNGTADPLVPYDGNPFVGYPSVDDTVQHWLDANDCTAGPAEVVSGRTTCETWTGCRDAAEVVLCAVEGGGHEWPPDSSGLSTSAEIWEFFSRHAR